MIIALNGWQYSIARFMPSSVYCHPELKWTRQRAIDFADELNKTVSTPTTLIGFSRGANAALVIAQRCHVVNRVYAHSCTFRKFTARKRDFDLTLFRTSFDRTPTAEGTELTWKQYRDLGYDAKLHTFNPEPWQPKGWIEHMMDSMDHQFHNCLPFLRDACVLV